MKQDLLVFLGADIYTAGYIVAWISLHCRLEELEALVDELDDVYTRAGRSLLTGKPKKK